MGFGWESKKAGQRGEEAVRCCSPIGHIRALLPPGVPVPCGSGAWYSSLIRGLSGAIPVPVTAGSPWKGKMRDLALVSLFQAKGGRS